VADVNPFPKSKLAADSLDALLAENQQQAARIESLAAELVHADAEVREAQAENQQLRREVEHLRALLARRDEAAAVRVEER
jgi:regulator of replication initiation timing